MIKGYAMTYPFLEKRRERNGTKSSRYFKIH